MVLGLEAKIGAGLGGVLNSPTQGSKLNFIFKALGRSAAARSSRPTTRETKGKTTLFSHLVDIFNSLLLLFHLNLIFIDFII